MEQEILALKEENKKQKLEIKVLKSENEIYQFRISQLEKAIFGAKRERFVPDTPEEQISLFDDTTKINIEEPSIESAQAVAVKTKPKSSTTQTPRKHNTFPAHLPREVQVILPEKHQQCFKEIGTDITEILKYTPMELIVKRIERPRYLDPTAKQSPIYQANIPPRIIPKGLIDDSLLVALIIEKFEYHMPIYRFVKKLRKAGITFIKAKHLYNYLAKVGQLLQPLHVLMLQQLLKSHYVQMDESGIRVLSQDKEHGKLRGCMWVMNAPTSNLVLYNYRPSKEKEYAYELLNGYQGALHTDGNTTYQGIADVQPNMKLMGKYSVQVTDFLNCWAHTRRKFYEAKDLNPGIIHPILTDIQGLYAIESEARNQKLNSKKRKQLRQEQAIPLLNSIKDKLDRAAATNITGPVNKAIKYTLKRWENLTRYTENGDWEIDTNLLENKIRPLALGRKNYLFAKTDETAQHVATFYSLIGSCHMNGIDPFKYLTWLFKKMTVNKMDQNAINWLPHLIDQEVLE